MRLVKKIAQKKLFACAIIGAVVVGGGSWRAQAAETAAPDPYSLDQIVVTANRIPTKAALAAANIVVVTREEIEKQDSKTLVDVLKNVNGAVFSGQGWAGGEQQVLLNGDARVLVLIDGRRMNLNKTAGNYPSSTYDLNTFISLDNVERIEVVKGAGSALYGTDAVGGVINIITRKGEKNQTTLDASLGSWGTGNYNLTQSGSHKDWSWFLTAGKAHQNFMAYKDYRTGGVVNQANTEYDQNNLTLRMDKQLDPNSSLTFNFEHADDKKGSPYSTYVNDQNSYYNSLSNNVALTYNYKMKSQIPAHLRVYQNYYAMNYHSYYYSTWTQYPKYDREIGLDWQDGWQLDRKNLLTAGLEWRNSQVMSETVYEGTKSITTAGVYLEDRMLLSPRWTLTPGVRYDNHSMFGGHFTPRVALNYQADAGTNLYASWGKVFRAPTTDDLFYDDYYTHGDPNLKPETGYTLTFGFNKKLNTSTVLTGSYFLSELADAIRWTYDPNTWQSYAQNVDRMRKQGVEIALQTTLSPEWKLNAGYAWLKREITDQYHADLYADPYNPGPNTYRLGLNYHKKAWNIDMTLLGVSGCNTDYFAAGTYWVLNMVANYQYDKNTKLYFKWNNITNRAYDAWGAAGSPGAFPMPASNWQIGVKYMF